MDFKRTDKQAELVDAFRDFSQAWFSDESILQWQRDQGLPDDVCKAFVDLYYRFPELDPEESESGSLFAQVLVTEEVSRAAGASLPFANDIMNLRIMGEFADSAQVKPLMEEYRATGRLTFALAVSEPQGGSDTMNMQTSVQTTAGKTVLNGSKTYVVNGEYAPNIMVAAIDRDAPKGKYPVLSFWLLPRSLAGISAFPINKVGQKILPFADVVLDHVQVDASQRLTSAAGAGFPQLFHLLEIGRMMVCAQSLGLAQAAMEDAVAHAKQRQAFGKRIGDFQQIKQMLVDMEVKLTNMRNVVYRAAWDYDHDEPEKRLSVALMKRYVPQAATEVASDALQILGGRGYTENERVSWIWQDCRGNQISEGTDQIMVNIAAPLLMERY